MSNRKDSKKGKKGIIKGIKKNFKSMKGSLSSPSGNRRGRKKNSNKYSKQNGQLLNMNVNSSKSEYSLSNTNDNIREPSVSSLNNESRYKSPRSPSSRNKRTSLSNSNLFNESNYNPAAPWSSGSLTSSIKMDRDNKASTIKLKSAPKKFSTFTFKVPNLHSTNEPELIEHLQRTQSLRTSALFGYLKNGKNSTQTVIPISVDVEQTYNDIYGQKYNRKILGPLQPICFPIIIDCMTGNTTNITALNTPAPNEEYNDINANNMKFSELSKRVSDNAGFDENESDYFSESSNDEDDMDPLRLRAKNSRLLKKNSGMKNKGAHGMQRSTSLHFEESELTEKNKKQKRNVSVSGRSRQKNHESNDVIIINGPIKKRTSEPNTIDTKPLKHIEYKHHKVRSQGSVLIPTLTRPRSKKIRPKHKQQHKYKTTPVPQSAVDGMKHDSVFSPIPEQKERYNEKQRNIIQNNGNMSEDIDDLEYIAHVPLKLLYKYDKMDKITSDEIEILSRRLLHAKRDMNEEKEKQFQAKNKIKIQAKRRQNHHILHSNVNRKSHSVVFGLQLLDSVKQVSAKLSSLFTTFSDGMSDLLRICKEFNAIIVDQLPKQVFSDYSDNIDEYASLVNMIAFMTKQFSNASQKLDENQLSLNSVLRSTISNRVNEYDDYSSDLQSANHSLATLQIHCDRTIRRLFREIPKPKSMNTTSAMNDDGMSAIDASVFGKKYKNVSTFGRHFIAKNSNELIVRSVPSSIRNNMVSDYIHYLTLIDTLNHNQQNYHDEILPKMSVEFEASQDKLKTSLTSSLSLIDSNLSFISMLQKKQEMDDIFIDNIAYNIKDGSGGGGDDLSLSFNVKPYALRNALPGVMPFDIRENELIASPMQVQGVLGAIQDYIHFEEEKRKFNDTYDDYYHLGHILFEIPGLYQSFANYLSTKLSLENLLFLRSIDDIYFNQVHGFNHTIAVHEARGIYKKFISNQSICEVNLPGTITKQINRDLKIIKKRKDPVSIFDKAYACISSLIVKEMLTSYYQSSHFKLWQQNQSNQKK